ncbi:MAG TPA: hypothetical protein VE359_01720, partial [Vicinamibacteria bacterium]|nr:hypothetical protein [Vicinamibacteria bacterium]
VLVLHPEAGELQPHEVEDVGDARVGRQEARAAGQGGGALGGEILGLFDPGWTMVAANAAREQWWPPLEQQEILAVSVARHRFADSLARR